MVCVGDHVKKGLFHRLFELFLFGFVFLDNHKAIVQAQKQRV